MEQPPSPQTPFAADRDHKSRKSVSFTAEQEVVDPFGTVTRVMSTDDTRDTAVSHTPRTPTLAVAAAAKPNSDSNNVADSLPGSAVPLATTEPSSHTAAAAADAPRESDAPAEDGGLDLTMKKKKKKKKKDDDDDGAEDGAGPVSAPSADPATGSVPVDDGGLDLTMKKKRKKKVEDDFTAKLKKLEIDGSKTEGAAAEGADAVADDGDMAEGTGLWAHNESRSISYNLLLDRFFFMLSQKHPDHALSGSRSYKIPPPLCMREGNKKTIFANLAEICKRMKRSEDHVTAYLFAELGTSGSTDGSRRLVIKGRFQQKQIEAVLRTYIMEYVTCATCKSADTELSKGENRLYFITCNSCGSRRSVLAIKTGFSAQVGKRKKMG